jgi:hypothetical protein
LWQTSAPYSLSSVLFCEQLRLQSFHTLVFPQSIIWFYCFAGTIFQEHKDDDGFLYITYSGEKTFGYVGDIDKAEKEIHDANDFNTDVSASNYWLQFLVYLSVKEYQDSFRLPSNYQIFGSQELDKNAMH